MFGILVFGVWDFWGRGFGFGVWIWDLGVGVWGSEFIDKGLEFRF